MQGVKLLQPPPSSLPRSRRPNARVKATTRDVLLYLGVNHSYHGLVNAVVATAAASTGSSAYPRMMLSESPCASCMQPIPAFHVYPEGSRFFAECSSEVSIVAPSTPAPVTINLNAMPMAGGSSFGGMRKRQREMPADMLTGDRNLFDEMPTVVDDDTVMRTSTPLLHPQPQLLYILDQLLDLVHAN